MMLLLPGRAAWSLQVIGLALLLGGAGCKRGNQAQPEPRRLHVRVIEIEVTDRTPPDQPGARAAGETDLVSACTEGLRRAGVDVALLPASTPQPSGDFRLQMDLHLEHVQPSADTEQQGLMRALTRGRLRAMHGEPDPKAPPVELPRFDQDALAERVYLAGPATGAPGGARKQRDRTGPGRPLRRGTGEPELPALQGPPTAARWAEHARRAVQDTAEALGSQVRLLGADRQMLVLTLQRKELDPDLRGVAIELAGLRKEREAVPALMELLRDQEAEVRDKTIGALIEIGDRRAVKALAQSAPFQDTVELAKILEAVATLGGDEARSYLSFVAAGHDNQQIREDARAALAHLEQREGRSDAASPQ